MRILRAAASFGRSRRTQIATISRVSVKAVNTVVTMPMASVTAKPRTGPEPRQNRTTAAISVVSWSRRWSPRPA